MITDPQLPLQRGDHCLNAKPWFGIRIVAASAVEVQHDSFGELADKTRHDVQSISAEVNVDLLRTRQSSSARKVHVRDVNAAEIRIRKSDELLPGQHDSPVLVRPVSTKPLPEWATV